MNYNKIKVCHFTSVHPAKDGRIFHKECSSLAKAGYDVSLVVAGAESEVCQGVKIIGVPTKKSGRLKRMFKTAREVYKAALKVDADIYHFHDPELLPYGLKLKRKGKKVIFDSHEDYVSNIKEKKYLNKYLSRIVSFVYSSLERYILMRIDAAIGVTPHLTERLARINHNTVQVTNYKIISDSVDYLNIDPKTLNLAFVGPIREQWCVKEIIKSIVGSSFNSIQLNLAGPAESDYLSTLKTMKGWSLVNYYGKVTPREVNNIYCNSYLGFALLRYSLAVGGNIGTLGNTKIFEIMGAGIPVICTDFILWEKIIDDYKCGICVNPTDESQITNAIDYLLTHPEEARQMGENGKKAVIAEFNWESQEKILFGLYESLTKDIKPNNHDIRRNQRIR